MTTALITRNYNGLTFIFREDGYFNMTFAAKHFGKQLGNFWMNVSTREYMVELAQALFPETPWKPNEYPNHEHNLTLARNALVASGMGRNGGTFAHPRLAVFFARWLDTKFAVWCDAVIHDILTKKAELTITKPEQSAVLQVGLPDTLMVLQQQMQANQQMLQALIDQTRRTAALEKVAETHTKTLEVMVDTQEQVVAKVQSLEKDVKFSHSMLTFDDFYSGYGIQRRKDGRRSLTSVFSQQMQGKSCRMVTKAYHSDSGSTLGNVKTYQEEDLIAVWKRLRLDPRFDQWVYKDTTRF